MSDDKDYCVICGRVITAPASVERGYGGGCAKTTLARMLAPPGETLLFPQHDDRIIKAVLDL